MEIVENIKKNRALWIGGAVLVGAVFLFLYMRGGGTTVVQSGPSDQQTAINAELQARQMEIQGQIAIAGMQIAAQQQNAANELAALELSAATQLDALEMQLQAQTHIANQEYELGLEQISSQEAILELQAQTQIARDEIAAELSLAQSTLQADVYRQMAQSQADQAIAALEAQKEIALGNIYADLESDLAREETMLKLGLDQGRTQRHGQSTSMIGSIFGGILGLFSDVRLKSNIQFVGFRNSGLPQYSYTMPDGSRQIGVMAQDALNTNPGAVYSRGDYLEVDYRRV